MELVADNISFLRNDFTVFSGISFSLSRGYLLLVKGDNGSGKTTLLRILAGIIRTFSGEVIFNGANITKCYQDYLSQITYIGHDFACWGDKAVIENLEFWAKFRKTQELLLPTLHFFDLFPVVDILFKKLSSGWKKRVCLANLMLFNSKIWLLDEPFVNLDQKNKIFIKTLLESRLERGGIIILTSHEEFEIKAPTIKRLNLQ